MRNAFRAPGTLPGAGILRISRNGSRKVTGAPSHLLRSGIEAFGAAEAFLRVREKITRTLPGRVQPRDRLVEVDADPPDQPGRADQLTQRLPQGASAAVAVPRAAASAASAAYAPRARPGPPGRRLQVR